MRHSTMDSSCWCPSNQRRTANYSQGLQEKVVRIHKQIFPAGSIEWCLLMLTLMWLFKSVMLLYIHTTIDYYLWPFLIILHDRPQSFCLIYDSINLACLIKVVRLRSTLEYLQLFSIAIIKLIIWGKFCYFCFKVKRNIRLHFLNNKDWMNCINKNVFK